MKRNNSGYTFLNVSLMWLGLVLVIGSACSDISQQEKKKIEEALRDSLLSVTESWDVDMQLIENGKNVAHITGSHAAQYEQNKKKVTKIQGPVTITVYDDSAEVNAVVKSNRAEYQSEDMIFHCYGNVRVDTKENRHLESEYLYWNRNIDSVKTPDFVVITTPSDSISGTGFKGTLDLSSYSIKNVQGRVQIDSQ